MAYQLRQCQFEKATGGPEQSLQAKEECLHEPAEPKENERMKVLAEMLSQQHEKMRAE